MDLDQNMALESTQDAASEAFIKLANIAQCRADLYQLFAISFQNPTQELVQDLQSGVLTENFITCFDTIAQDNTLYEEALSELKAFTEIHQNDDPVQLLSDLRVEYTRLFIGPTKPVVPPYETLHRETPGKDGEPLLFVSPTAMSVERYYREAGVKMAINDSPDHLTTELEFLVYLCNKEADAWEEADNDQARDFRKKERDFHDEHLSHWGIDFCRRTREADDSGFFTALSALLALYLHIEEGGFRPI
jgi:DMSO reductase family type II enzyme chaperone